MADGVEIEWNEEGIAELLSSSEAVQALGEIAALAGREVENAMPEKTGRARRSIVTSAGVEDGKAVGSVGTTSSIWHLLEYGSSTNPAYRPFARGIEAAGLSYEALPE